MEVLKMSKSKKIRRSLRGQGINPDERSYIEIRNSNNSVTFKLDPKCGRAIYQNLKKGVTNETL